MMFDIKSMDKMTLNIYVEMLNEMILNFGIKYIVLQNYKNICETCVDNLQCCKKQIKKISVKNMAKKEIITMRIYTEKLKIVYDELKIIIDELYDLYVTQFMPFYNEVSISNYGTNIYDLCLNITHIQNTVDHDELLLNPLKYFHVLSSLHIKYMFGV